MSGSINLRTQGKTAKSSVVYPINFIHPTGYWLFQVNVLDVFFLKIQLDSWTYLF